MCETFAYLIWDPKPGMFDFNLPILNRPILWYGFLFAFGFFIGYLILTYLLRRYLLLNTEFHKEDVISWPDLIKILSVQRLELAKAIFSRLDKTEQEWCQRWKPGNEISETTKIAIVAAINQIMTGPQARFEIPLSSLSQRLCAFAKKWILFQTENVKSRLILEENLKPFVSSLKIRASKIAEQMTFYVIIGAIVGSRLGDVIFYQNWEEIIRHPLSIIAVWQGGLASHGGAVGILIALWIFSKKRKLSFWTAVDFTVIPTAIAAVLIRIGNFFNQEILGKTTSLPWGVIFLHPADGGPIAPRHPAQLYEASWYLCVFVLLLLYWHRHFFEPKGRLTGLFLLLVFGFRFLIEFLKVEQSALLSGPESMLTMGQWLSLPFIFLGVWLVWRRKS